MPLLVGQLEASLSAGIRIAGVFWNVCESGGAEI